MLILDIDHFSELLRGGPVGRRLELRLAAANIPVATTVITLEEQARGWLAELKRAKTDATKISVYSEFQRLFFVVRTWTVVPWSLEAAQRLNDLKRRKIRVGTSDLHIAAITMATSGRLLSRNLKDFGKIGGLGVEDWLT